MEFDFELPIGDVVDRGIFAVASIVGHAFSVEAGGSVEAVPLAFFFASMWCVGTNRRWTPKLMVEDTRRSEGVSQQPEDQRSKPPSQIVLRERAQKLMQA
jgi:hypothetical protein